MRQENPATNRVCRCQEKNVVNIVEEVQNISRFGSGTRKSFREPCMTVAGKTCREPCMGGAIYNYGERLENPDENLVLIGFYKIVTVLICKNNQKLVV